jgi:hypothetical protein
MTPTVAKMNPMISLCPSVSEDNYLIQGNRGCQQRVGRA